MDKIFLSGMEFYGYHGVFAAENQLGQRFRVDLECWLDLTAAGESDELGVTVSYADLYQLIHSIMEQEPHAKLLERLAHKIITNIFTHYPIIEEIQVRVIKPDPPIPGHYQNVGVEMRRRRNNYEE
jgi:dihydroneopterin aldolase